MFKLIFFVSVLLAMFVTPASGAEVVISAGTELQVVSSSALDTGSMQVGDDANFLLATDVSATILKGTEIYGRVVEVEKFDGAKGESRIVLMFDFLKVGEEFYAISAVVMSTGMNVQGLRIEKSKDFAGGTNLMMKGGEMNIAAGTSFTLKVEDDVTNE
ncbi:MAG: hypothetical protein OEM82_00215 [Acidobacteriota bacterium]|nr:hypothetical protein [Acidobacteriota bacterium]MDH3530811.1 hypothetical protein [Acidobacteriota bacterium]